MSKGHWAEVRLMEVRSRTVTLISVSRENHVKKKKKRTAGSKIAWSKKESNWGESHRVDQEVRSK